MEFGALPAYKRIDVAVEKTLRAAAEVLRDIETGQDEEERDRGHPMERKSITVTSCSLSSVTSGQRPRATIRTPNDARPHRKMYFPRASIGPMIESPNDLSSVSSANTGEPMAPTPDSLFPRATYIPAKKGSQINVTAVPSGRPSSVSSDSIGPHSEYRVHIEKLAVEPLEDIKHLRCRGQKKSKPDSLFPSATYRPGTGKPKLALSPASTVPTATPTISSSNFTRSSSSASSYVYQPMEFLSTNGRVKMLLQPLETNEEPNKHSIKKPLVKETEFPIVPRQLESNQNLKFERTKFSTMLSIGENTIDLSGIFRGSSLKKGDLAKLVINGQSYSL